LDRAIKEFYRRRAERLRSKEKVNYDSVEAFRRRRARRLDDREPDAWISTEDGTHIPLDESGKAIGGPLKGEDFSDAKKTKPIVGKKLGEKRGQIDAGVGEVEDNEIDEFNQKAFESIKEETGYDNEKAQELQRCMIEYLGGDYSAFRMGKRKKQEEIIDNGLARMGTFDGEISRGLTFFDDDEEGRSSFDYFRNLQIGAEIKMDSVSSWTSDDVCGLSYAECSNFRTNSVVITCKNNKTGVGVQHISKFRDLESEVLAPSKAKWRVVGKRIVDKVQVAKELEERYNEALGKGRGSGLYVESELDALEELRANNYTAKQRSVVFLEVEEID